MFPLLIVTLALFIIVSVLYFILLSIYLVQRTYIKIPAIMTESSDLQSLIEDEKITSKDIVYDLGCGNGSVLFSIEKSTGARTQGYETSIVPFLIAHFLKFWGNYKTSISLRSFLKVDLSDPTVVYLYLGDTIMRQLEPIFATRLKHGTRVISCDFELPTKEAARTHRYKKHTFFVYAY
jgi:hypothetical protein